MPYWSWITAFLTSLISRDHLPLTYVLFPAGCPPPPLVPWHSTYCSANIFHTVIFPLIAKNFSTFYLDICSALVHFVNIWGEEGWCSQWYVCIKCLTYVLPPPPHLSEHICTSFGFQLSPYCLYSALTFKSNSVDLLAYFCESHW
jgi:hypothetical protein